MSEQYTKLVGTGTSGNVVHATQTMAAKEGFKFVSRPWYLKTTPIEDGIKKVSDDVAAREDIIGAFPNVTPRVNENNELVMDFSDGRTFKPTDHALRQYLSRIHVPYTYVSSVLSGTHYSPDDEDFDVLVELLENGQRHIDRKKKFRFRTYKDGTLRAVLTTDYSPVDNRWYLEQLHKLLPGARLSHWRGDADTLWGNVLIPDTIREEKDSDYGGMVSISNCEIGLRRLDQKPSVFRAICMNGCIWDQLAGIAISRVHRGIDMVQLKAQIAENIHAQIPIMGNLVDNFLKLQTIDMKPLKLRNVFGVIGLDYKLTPREAVSVLTNFSEFERDNRNAFGVVNAFTRAGQLLDNETWVRFDKIGGELAGMKEKGWERIIERSKTFDKELMKQVYGVAV